MISVADGITGPPLAGATEAVLRDVAPAAIGVAPVMSAAVLMSMIPVLVLFAVTQDKIVHGWASAVR